MSREEELARNVSELSARVRDLEGVLSKLMGPINQMEKATRGYLRLVDLALRGGGLTIDSAFPDVKDPICKDIMRALIERDGQNISQIAKSLKQARGSASRKTVREKLIALESRGLVESREIAGEKVAKYYLTDEVTRKWSEMLGILK